MKAKSEAQAYSDSHGWKKVGDKGTAGLYSNGTLFVMCNGTEWFASKTPDASGRWAKGWANILPAMRFADAHKGKRSEALSKAQAKYDGRQRKVTIRLDEQADADLIARIEAQPSMTAYIKELVRRDMER